MSGVRKIVVEQIKPNYSSERNQYGAQQEPQQPVCLPFTLRVNVEQETTMKIAILFRILISGELSYDIQ